MATDLEIAKLLFGSQPSGPSGVRYGEYAIGIDEDGNEYEGIRLDGSDTVIPQDWDDWAKDGTRISYVSDGSTGTIIDNSAASSVLVFDTTYVTRTDSIGREYVTVTAHVYRTGIEVTHEYAPECFTWFLKRDETGTSGEGSVPDGVGYEFIVYVANYKYGGTVVGVFDPDYGVAALLDVDGNDIESSDGTRLYASTFTDSGFVKVTDLPDAYSVSENDYLMGFSDSSTYKARVGVYTKKAVEETDSELDMTAAQIAALLTI